jgi:hypothetical protein
MNTRHLTVQLIAHHVLRTKRFVDVVFAQHNPYATRTLAIPKKGGRK